VFVDPLSDRCLERGLRWTGLDDTDEAILRLVMKNATDQASPRRDSLSVDDCVLLDFEGVDTVTGSFLNTAVGCLYSALSVGDLDLRLRWRGLDDTDEGIIRLVMEKAAFFYRASLEQREIMTSVSAHAMDH
jgi:hypothetical protein